MIDSSIDNFHVEIKSEPRDPVSDEESSSCIEYQNVLEPLELKYEAEDDQVEEQSRSCLAHPRKKEPVKIIKPVKKWGFEEDLEELDKNLKNFRIKYKEEIIVRKFYASNFKNCEISGSKSKLLDTLANNLRILNEEETSDSVSVLLIIPFAYPIVSFNLLNKSAVEKCFEDMNNVPKIELKNGIIKFSHQDEITKILNIFENITNVKNIIDNDDGQLWKLLECNPHKKPFSVDKSTPNESMPFKKLQISLKDFKNLKIYKSPAKALPTDIKIKDEPIDNPEPVIPDIKIKEEHEDQPMLSSLPLYLTEDQPGTSQQEDTYIITELDDVKQEITEDNFSYFTSNFPETSTENKNNDDEDEFQYNTVNSFKSDLATRRSVSHTVVSGNPNKSKAEAALMAMQELMKIEQDKKLEKERSASGLNQVEKPKTMNVSLNVNGIRVVTKVSLPSVSGVVKKPVKTVEEECKYQCPICFIKFKTDGQLIGHKRIHDTAKAKLNTADMTKNVYREVKMRIEQIGNRRSIHVLLPNYDYAFIVTNSTANKLYMKCFRQACEVKAYSTNDGKFFVKVGEEHCHGPDREVILSKIDEKKRSDLEKTEVINKSVQEAIAQKQRQKSQMEEKKHALIERIKRSQEAGVGRKVIQEVKKRKID
ncbi:unnamed protein product [Chironomus riparius]|uniref:C2H2-type domain-containing protein n=1 Tax=Chironomus riparius TaxID=315576 RepID=A0A9N9S6W5_9DIPT|nr:unnamed protein product [Chironomus riparius]